VNNQAKISHETNQKLHDELSATIRRSMFALLVYSASCGVIVAQPDVPFVLTASGVRIPVINADVNLNAFLIVGPLGLIVITGYLHLFLAKLDGINGIYEYEKRPFLFNFKDCISQFLSFLVFYATPILMMIAFSWKSSVTTYRIFMYFSTSIVTAGIIWLYLKRRFIRSKFIIICASVMSSLI